MILILIVATAIYFITHVYKRETFTSRSVQMKGIMNTATALQLAGVLSSARNNMRTLDFYNYSLDGNAMTIRTGGQNMFTGNGGNTTSIYVDGDISREVNYQTIAQQILTMNNKQIQHLSLGYFQPLAYVCKSGQRAMLGFQKTGVLGANRSGIQAAEVVCRGKYFSTFRVFAWRRIVYNTTTPTVCDLYFAIGDNMSAFHNEQMFVSMAETTGDGASRFYMDVTNVLMGTVLLSRPNGLYIPIEECEKVVENMCKVLYDRLIGSTITASVDDSFKCKDCLISLMIDKNMTTTQAQEEVEKLLKVRPDEYLTLMGQNPNNLPANVRGQLPAMELNEIISQLNKVIEINEFGEKIHMRDCLVPLSLIKRMMNDSPQSVRFDNNIDDTVKVLVLGNMRLETNIHKRLPDDINALINNFDPEKYGSKEFGAYMNTGNNSEVRRVLIQLFALSDSVTMRRINELLNTYGITLRELQHAKEQENISIRDLSVAKQDNNMAQASQTASQNILNQQIPKTQAAQSREWHQISRTNNSRWHNWWLRHQGFYSTRGNTR